MNMDRMTEDEIMIAELERIIRAEEAKPDGERDAQLIDDCIKEMAEIKGVRAEYSPEEVAEITEKLIRDTEKEKAKRKKLVRRVAGIAAAFVIVFGASACAFNPALINWIATVIRLPTGSVIENSTVKYIYQGEIISYNNMCDFIDSALSQQIYYPANLPEDIRITEIRATDIGNAHVICFVFNDPELKYTIQTNYQEKNNIVKEHEVIEINESLKFYLYKIGDSYIAQNLGDTILYTLEYIDADTLHYILKGMSKFEYENY